MARKLLYLNEYLRICVMIDMPSTITNKLFIFVKLYHIFPLSIFWIFHALELGDHMTISSSISHRDQDFFICFLYWLTIDYMSFGSYLVLYFLHFCLIFINRVQVIKGIRNPKFFVFFYFYIT